jgi:hypothetical protein
MKTYGGVILGLGNRWKSVVSFTLRPRFPQRNSVPYPLYSTLSGPQSRSGRCREYKNCLPLPRIEPRFLGIQPVAIPGKLSFPRSFNTSGEIEYDRFGMVADRGVQKLLPVAAKKDCFITLPG